MKRTHFLKIEVKIGNLDYHKSFYLSREGQPTQFGKSFQNFLQKQ